MYGWMGIKPDLRDCLVLSKNKERGFSEQIGTLTPNK
jgi:hypothetical protein